MEHKLTDRAQQICETWDACNVVMQRLDHTPSCKKAGGTWYKSPFHQDTCPSFRVTPDGRAWWDYGNGRRGRAIDLIQELLGCGFREAVEWFCGESAGECRTTALPMSQDEAANRGFPYFEIKPLQHPALLSYLRSRGISDRVAIAFCSEAHYSFEANRKPLFALAFPNYEGGWELRSKNFKGCTSKHISFSLGHTSNVVLFEGFIDLLSWVEWRGSKGTGGASLAVLNSVSLVGEFLANLSPDTHVWAYLDSDAAGDTAMSRISAEIGGRLHDMRGHFRGYKDVNEWWAKCVLVNIKK